VEDYDNEKAHYEINALDCREETGDREVMEKIRRIMKVLKGVKCKRVQES
jgi:hypothetical protein